MSLERVGRGTRQTQLRELVEAITGDAGVNSAWHSLRAGDRENAVVDALTRNFGGAIVRLYVPADRRQRDERDRRVRALAAPPRNMPLAQIARTVGLSVRQVMRILDRPA